MRDVLDYPIESEKKESWGGLWLGWGFLVGFGLEGWLVFRYLCVRENGFVGGKVLVSVEGCWGW